MLNIIRELKRTTGVNKYEILTILDWRSLKYRKLYKDFSKKNNVEIEVKALVSGEIKGEDNKIYCDEEEKIIDERTDISKINVLTRKREYLKFTGRFGINYWDILLLENECIKAANMIQETLGIYERLLVLGHGENIYIPSRIASYLKGDVYFKSTTRSPIYCSDEKDYLIREKSTFYHNEVKYYFYNKLYTWELVKQLIFLKY